MKEVFRILHEDLRSKQPNYPWGPSPDEINNFLPDNLKNNPNLFSYRDNRSLDIIFYFPEEKCPI